MDIDLVTRAQGGDQEAFADLVYAIADRFLAVSHRTLSDKDAAPDPHLGRCAPLDLGRVTMLDPSLEAD